MEINVEELLMEIGKLTVMNHKLEAVNAGQAKRIQELVEKYEPKKEAKK